MTRMTEAVLLRRRELNATTGTRESVPESGGGSQGIDRLARPVASAGTCPEARARVRSTRASLTAVGEGTAAFRDRRLRRLERDTKLARPVLRGWESCAALLLPDPRR